VGRGVVALPSGWWASRSPGGASANALTTEELTDRGGGAAVHSARVEVEAVRETAGVGREHASEPVEV
jgi:anaerobic selenocysteine-containing dehydrogenase